MKYVYIVIFVLFFYTECSSAVCKRFFGSGVSKQEQNDIVNRHNKYRKQIANNEVKNQPKSSNMKKMQWDDYLASQADNIAKTCEFEHKRVTDSRFQWVGQNLYYAASSRDNHTADWNAAIDAWFDEHKTYNFDSKTYNHYTQVVWAETYLVGCGFAYYQNNPKWYEKLYVCNYAPGGNIIGQTPYKVGKGCENLC